mmetsp:Transcript_52832/g.124039  ORF Transcript_52832/g.124039 Transcript_52832/m.124039 type:complete len:378 (-) Transcript_52832:1013-2146(-)
MVWAAPLPLGGPPLEVVPHGARAVTHAREHLSYQDCLWCNQMLDEGDLDEWHVDTRPVIQRSYRHLADPLPVSLLEKLLGEARCPGRTNLPGFQGIGIVREVQKKVPKSVLHIRIPKVLLHLCLGFGQDFLFLFVVFPQQLMDVFEEVLANLIVPQHVRHERLVARRIAVQNRTDDDLTNISTSRLVEVTEDRCFRRTREAEKLGTGHVLQAGLVVVEQGQLVTGVTKKTVVHTKMTNIMCQSCQHEGMTFMECQEVGRRGDVKDDVQRESYVDCVDPIMKRNFLLISKLMLQLLHELTVAGVFGQTDRSSFVEPRRCVKHRHQTPCKGSSLPGIQLCNVEVPGEEVIARDLCWTKLLSNTLHQHRELILFAFCFRV